MQSQLALIRRRAVWLGQPGLQLIQLREHNLGQCNVVGDVQQALHILATCLRRTSITDLATGLVGQPLHCLRPEVLQLRAHLDFYGTLVKRRAITCTAR